MPNELPNDVVEEGQEPEPQPEGEQPPAPAAPQFVPVDDFKQQMALLNNTMSTLQEGIRAMSASRQSEPSREPALPPDLTDEEINNALREGENPAKVIRRLVANTEARFQSALEHRAKQIEDFGVTSISRLAAEAAKPKMKHYPKYQKEIDGYVSQLHPSQRTSPETYQVAHDVVVGQHIDEIVQEHIEADRRRRTAPVAQPGTSGGRGTTTQPQTPSVEELLGKEAAQELRARGKSADQYAQQWGKKDWAEFAKLIREQQGQETQ
jgi:hypothetical protein